MLLAMLNLQEEFLLQLLRDTLVFVSTRCSHVPSTRRIRSLVALIPGRFSVSYDSRIILSEMLSSSSSGRLGRSRSLCSVSARSSEPRIATEHLSALGQHQAIAAASLAFERAHSKEEDGKNLLASRQKSMSRRRSQRSLGEYSLFGSNHLSRRRSTKRQSTSSSMSVDRACSFRRTLRPEEPSPKQSLNQNVRSELTTKDHESLAAGHAESRMSSLSFNRDRKARSTHGYDTVKNECQDYKMSGNAALVGADMISGPVHGSHEQQDLPFPLHPAASLERLQNSHQNQQQQLQQLQPRKIRHRASFMFDTLRKRGEGFRNHLSGTTENGVTYDGNNDNNRKNDGTPLMEIMQRKFSEDSSKKLERIADKLKRYFRRPSSGKTELPAQQVEATRLYFGNLLSTIPTNHHVEDENFESPSFDVQKRNMARATSPAQSEITYQTKSRVTSWADSTIADTVASHESNRLTSIMEDSPEDDEQTLGKEKERRSVSYAGSFLRRFVRRTPGQVQSGQLSPTDGVPEALQKLHKNDGDFNGSVYDTLPSQRRFRSFGSKLSSGNKTATVRVVTPDNQITPEVDKETASNPTRDSSSSPNEQLGGIKSRKDVLWGVRDNLQKEVPQEQAVPTPEKIASRMERSNQRWKGPLEDSQSLFFPTSSSPTRNRSARPSDHSIFKESTTKEFAEIREPASGRTFGTLSPSIYSQQSDNESQKDVAVDSAVSVGSKKSDDTGTAVVISSQQVARHSLEDSPERNKGHAIHPSRDWQAWLSREVAEFDYQPKEDISIRADYLLKENRHKRECTQIVDEEENKPGRKIGTNIRTSTEVEPMSPDSVGRSNLHFTEPSVPKPEDLPKADERPSSRMNERFPIIETGRPVSRTRRRSSPANSSVCSVKTRTDSPVNGRNAPKSGLKTETTRNSPNTLTVPHSTQLPHRPNSRNSLKKSRIPRSSSSLAYYTTPTRDTPITPSRRLHHEPRGLPPATSVPMLPDQQLSPTPMAQEILPIPNDSTMDDSENINVNNTIPLRNRQSLSNLPNRQQSYHYHLDSDLTLLDILRGPYRDILSSQHSLSLTLNKENTAPGREDSTIMKSLRDEDRRSSPVKGSPASSATTSTGGHKLVDRWLNEKRQRDEEAGNDIMSSPYTPAFI